MHFAGSRHRVDERFHLHDRRFGEVQRFERLVQTGHRLASRFEQLARLGLPRDVDSLSRRQDADVLIGLRQFGHFVERNARVTPRRQRDDRIHRHERISMAQIADNHADRRPLFAKRRRQSLLQRLQRSQFLRRQIQLYDLVEPDILRL